MGETEPLSSVSKLLKTGGDTQRNFTIQDHASKGHNQRIGFKEKINSSDAWLRGHVQKSFVKKSFL